MKNYLKLLWVHTFYQLLELLRQPMYILTTLIFPAMFFWFFGAPNAKDAGSSALLVGSFSCFGVLGVVLFQFAIGIAQEKGTPWAHHLRLLPLHGSLMVLPRVINALIVSLLTVAAVTAVGIITTPFEWHNVSWSAVASALLAGAIPFTLLGATVGYAANSRTVVPLANLIYLPVSFAGGLWLPPNALPKLVQKISEYLPTRYFGEVVWAAILKRPLLDKAVWGLVVYTVVFAVSAVLLFKRNQEQEYR